VHCHRQAKEHYKKGMSRTIVIANCGTEGTMSVHSGTIDSKEFVQ